MKIKTIKIAGFRGFNEERTVDFNDSLTVISAPNSHGKTSISEALEFLLYGATSKVERADSKDEYKDSYRNRHFPAAEPAYIEAVFATDDGRSQILKVQLYADGTTIKFANDIAVKEWSFNAESIIAARPFVLQHALKYLLLVPPAERFQGFAQLVGLNEVDDVFRALLSLCTKPSANMPIEAQQLLNELSILEGKVGLSANLKKVAASLKKGLAGVSDAYQAIEAHADKLLNSKTSPADRVQSLKTVRSDASSKLYSGDIAFLQLTETQSEQLNSSRTVLSNAVNQKFLEEYGHLCVQASAAKLQNEAQLLNLGLELLTHDVAKCPLCLQSLTEENKEEIRGRHKSSSDALKAQTARQQAQPRVVRSVEGIRQALGTNAKLCTLPVAGLVSSIEPANKEKLTKLLGGPETAIVRSIEVEAQKVQAAQVSLKSSIEAVETALDACEASFKDNAIKLTDAENLGLALQTYLVASNDFLGTIKKIEPAISSPAKLFRQSLDALAGTAEISLIIELFEKRKSVEKSLRVRDVLEKLKELKKHVEQTLAETMESTMTGELTNSVMKWYGKIKTSGDPNVHFSGFSMDKTKTGDFKSRRLAVKAQSYGVELASAVSSLSESKLNALGLCVSIATAIRKPGPWSFLIVDDPIQSWDDEHETQFIDVIRSLVNEEGKQVVVLSHKGTWAKQVCEGCRSLNGFRYEITGYTKAGPNITALHWSPLEDRLREAEAIANDSNATSVRLQHAEEELRLAACQLASQIAKEKLSRTTSPHNMNKGDVRSILVTAGVAADAVDRIQATFVNSDDAHHAPKTYQPSAQRIKHAITSIREVLKLIRK
ncbi:MAG: AAA family ATPase [Limisphaerales bacterium]